MTKANPHAVTAKFVIGAGSPERAGGLGRGEMAQERWWVCLRR